MAGNHEALKKGLRSARAAAGYESDLALSLEAGVHLQTIQNWMYGKTTPRAHEMSKVAKVLDKPTDYFMALYEDREPEPPPLMRQLGELVTVVRELVDEMRRERRQGPSGPMSVNVLLDPSAIGPEVREGDERDRTRRGRGGPNKPVPLRPRPPRGTGEG